MLGASLGRPLYDPADPFCRARQPKDEIATIDHFYTKLLGLVHAMQTEAGRQEARVRTDFMFAYLAQLEAEIASNQSMELTR